MSDSFSPQRSLKDMVSDAMTRSKGQGVVQGSTLFFKNLAESISHSNRNLKIGLAFLTASFVVVAAGLGYTVYQSFRTQASTKSELEKSLSSLGAAARGDKESLVSEVTRVASELQKRQEDLEVRVRAESQTAVLNANAASDQARRDVEALKGDIQALNKRLDQMQSEWAAYMKVNNENWANLLKSTRHAAPPASGN